MGHPQPPTPLHTDNSTASGISNNTVKCQSSRAMEMRYFWIVDQVDQGVFNVGWYPGLENLGDYPSKHHPTKTHRHVRPWYTHMKNSPRVLPRALAPSTLRGCVKSPQAEGVGHYVPCVPLPILSGTSSSICRNTRNTQMAQLMMSSYALASALVHALTHHTKPILDLVLGAVS